MHYVVCIVSCCPIRREASHKTEMVSQLLFGETAEIIEAVKNFYKVRCLYDDYEGWVQRSQMTEATQNFILEYPKNYIVEHNKTALFDGNEIHLSLGTPLFDNGYFGKHKVEYGIENRSSYYTRPFTENKLREISFKFLNSPYLWGGRSSAGLDCSGFTQQVFKMFQKRLLRDSSQQALQGIAVDFLQQAKCGDLAFFDNEEGFITHTGILLSNEQIIHCSGRVKIDRIDTQGIINSDDGLRTHRLRIIKRF